MAISINHRIIGGVVETILASGNEPLPWMMFTLVSIGATWDRHGKRAQVKVKERVVVQGRGNLDALDWLRPGAEVLVTGVGLPVQTVAAQDDAKGMVTLAQTIQRPGGQEDY